MKKQKVDKQGRSAREVAESMVVNNKIKVSIRRVSGSSLHKVKKITKSGRVYLEGHRDITFVQPKLIKGEWYFSTKSWHLKKPDGFVEAYDDTCESYRIEA